MEVKIIERKIREMGQGSQAQIDADWRAFWAQNDRELAQERAAKVRLVQRLGVDRAAEIIKIHDRLIRGEGKKR